MTLKLLPALWAILIAAPGMSQIAFAADAPPDDEQMETMELVTDAEDQPSPDTETESNTTRQSDVGATNQSNNQSDTQQRVRTAPSVNMMPVGKAIRSEQLPAVIQPIQTEITVPPRPNIRPARFNRVDESTSTLSTDQATYQPLPTYRAQQPAPVQTYGTLRVQPIHTTARTVHPVNRVSAAPGADGVELFRFRERDDVVRDFVNESTGNLFVGLGRNTYVRRPKYEHRSGFRGDVRNIQTGRNYYALPRHGGGQDLFDPHRGRVIHGIKRRDGSIDYYDPITGRWILTQERRR